MRSRGFGGTEIHLGRGFLFPVPGRRNAIWLGDHPSGAGFPLSFGGSLSFSGFSLKGNSLGAWMNP